MKALYLNGRDGLTVGLDGPALRVCRPGRADGRYPLPRIARIIVVGAVRWHPDALLACLRDHKPLAVLDRQGRFVRVLFRRPDQQYGLARHMGDLLAVPRFRARYERWRQAAEKSEFVAAIQSLEIPWWDCQPDQLWQMICLEQYRRWGVRPGWCYRYLLGLAAAQIASAFLLIGMPRDSQAWQRQEYRLFCHMLQLERWHQAVLLEQMLAGGAGQPSRRDLTAAFEAGSREREQRITTWRERALVQMMGLGRGKEGIITCEEADCKPGQFDMSATVVRVCGDAHSRAGNSGHVPLGAPGSFRTSVRIVRAYLEYDRRVYESYGAA